MVIKSHWTGFAAILWHGSDGRLTVLG